MFDARVSTFCNVLVPCVCILSQNTATSLITPTPDRETCASD